MRTLGLLLCIAAPRAWGQLDSNTITVTSSVAVTAPLDSMSFSVSVSTPLSATLDQAVAVLQPAGVTASNLSSVYQSERMLQWSFSMLTPFSRVRDTVLALTAIQTNKQGFDVSFRGAGAPGANSASNFQGCPLPDLLAQATAQARSYANLAGVTLGPLLALSDAPQSTARPSYALLAISPTASLLNFQLGPINAPSPSCSLTVKFGILRYQ